MEVIGASANYVEFERVLKAEGVISRSNLFSSKRNSSVGQDQTANLLQPGNSGAL